MTRTKLKSEIRKQIENYNLMRIKALEKLYHSKARRIGDLVFINTQIGIKLIKPWLLHKGEIWLTKNELLKLYRRIFDKDE